MSCQCNADLYCCCLSFINRDRWRLGWHPLDEGACRFVHAHHRTSATRQIRTASVQAKIMKITLHYLTLKSDHMKTHYHTGQRPLPTSSFFGQKYYFQRIKEFRLMSKLLVHISKFFREWNTRHFTRENGCSSNLCANCGIRCWPLELLWIAVPFKNRFDAHSGLITFGSSCTCATRVLINSGQKNKLFLLLFGCVFFGFYILLFYVWTKTRNAHWLETAITKENSTLKPLSNNQAWNNLIKYRRMHSPHCEILNLTRLHSLFDSLHQNQVERSKYILHYCEISSK